jgi:hypothetical protein
MKSYKIFVTESAAGVGQKFAQMTDSQFQDWVSKNPGGAERAKKLRDAARAAQQTRTPQQPRATTTQASSSTATPQQPKATTAQPPKQPRGATPSQKAQEYVRRSAERARQQVNNQPRTSTPRTPGVTTPTPNRSVMSRVAGPAARVAGPALTALGAYGEYKRRRAEGEDKGTALRNTAIITGAQTVGNVVGGGLAGALGLPSGPGATATAAVGSIAGGTATGEVARSFLPTPKQKKDIQNAPIRAARQQQAARRTPGTVAGSGIVGAGGKTTYSRTPQGSAFVSTGTGKQRRTAQLPSQMALPGNRIGDLAFRGGKPTYLTRPSLEQQRQDPVSRFMRTVNPAFKRAEQEAQQRNLNRAKANTRQYYGKLGISQQKQQQLNPSLGPAPKTKTRFSGKLK